jgi:pyruvate/2-oxoglutarate dehydrogenase complex dihydrolipoamide dehydrogenase (E3) component
MNENPPLQVPPWDEFNQKLVQNAHPAEWINPSSSGPYNLVVIGAGTAGLVSAAGAALLGARVALIERHLMGGDCLNFGCVPSKALIGAARAAYAIREAMDFGIRARVEEISFEQTMRRVRRVRAEIAPHDSAQRFRDFGIDIYLGEASFTSDCSIQVAGQQLQFRKAIIATGARAAVPVIDGLESAGYLTNETVFSLTELPPRLVVIGGGPIGCELAQAFARLGSRVTVIEKHERLLPRDDADAAGILQAKFKDENISLILAAAISRVERSDAAKTVFLRDNYGEQQIETDAILVAAGRAPNIEALNIPAARVVSDDQGIVVNDRLQTSNPRIYAAGDISSRFQFTHAAEALGRIALRNALFYGRKRASKLVIPWCTYTDPEIAHVGLTAQGTEGLGTSVETLTLSLEEIDRAVVDGETSGFLRVHSRKQDGAILGATLVSRHAGESIGELVLAMQRGLTVRDLSGIIHPYPTQAESIKRLGDLAVMSQFKPPRLKPWMKNLLVKFFAWHR